MATSIGLDRSVLMPLTGFHILYRCLSEDQDTKASNPATSNKINGSVDTFAIIGCSIFSCATTLLTRCSSNTLQWPSGRVPELLPNKLKLNAKDKDVHLSTTLR
ncbi:hypothetical protein JHK84_048166 [Glycine max]|nr:hypothetical protein JHK85_048759 [Glycine max]KAG5103197.1 hypothetical protein JHK84_048166 [Glycine max]